MVDGLKSGAKINYGYVSPACLHDGERGVSEFVTPDPHGDSFAPQGALQRQIEIRLLEKCETIYNVRRKRDKIFGHIDLFCDPAWDILLYLFINHLEGKAVSKTSAAISSHAPLTTALRWLAILEKNGIVCHENDPTDKRRTYVTLTEAGIRDMTKVLQNL